MKNAFKILILVISLVLMLSLSIAPAFAEEASAENAKNVLVETYTDEEENVIFAFEDGRKYNATMNEWIVEVEDNGMSISFSTENAITSLNYMWQGMLCIFIVIGVIILAVYLMNFLSSRAEIMKQIKDSEKENEEK